MDPKRQDIVFHVPWYKIDEAQYGNTMTEIYGWGVRKIVAPQYFYRKECTEKGGFPGKINAIAKRSGIRFAAAHGLLGMDFDLGYADKNALDEHRRFLFELAEIGVITYTVHPGMHHPVSGMGRNLGEKFWTRFEHSLTVLLPVAEQTGITLALENTYEPFEPLARMVKLVNSFHHPRLGLCLDVGHANISGIGIEAFFELMAPLMVTCHLHDNNGMKDEHIAPGQGTIDWEKLGKALLHVPGLLHMETESRAWSQEVWRQFDKFFTWMRDPKTAEMEDGKGNRFLKGR